MPSLWVTVEESFPLTSRVTVVRLREEFGPGPMRGQEVRLAAPGREPLRVTVTGLTFVDGPDGGFAVTLVLCGAGVTDAPPGSQILFDWALGSGVRLGSADDHASIRDALRRALEEEGYLVRTAPGWPAALDFLNK